MVALKVLPSEELANEVARQRLLREATAAAALDHPNLCTVFDAGEDAGRIYMAMQLLEGVTLAARIRERRLGPDEVLDVARDVAAALAEAHAREIVHRDLKPVNVMLTPRGACVLDFGLAHSTTGREQAITREGHISGTVPYMAPEQVRGEPARPPMDVFSFGVMLFEMVSGRRPFDRDSAVATLTAILHDEAPAVPPAGGDARLRRLEALVGRMLAKDPQARPSTGEVVAEIEAIRDGRMNVADPPTTVMVAPAPPPPSSRSEPAPPPPPDFSSDPSLVSRSVDPEARRLYVRGRRLWDKRTPLAVQEAIACFQAAIDVDPHFPDAYGGIADAYTFLSFLDFVSPRMMLARSRAAAQRALDLRPDDSRILGTLAFVKALGEWDWAGARGTFERALGVDETNPTAHHWFGILLAMRGEIGEARAHLGRAFDLDPLSPIVALSPQFADYYAGDFRGASRACRDVVHSEPAFAPARYYLGRALEAAGDLEEAAEEYRVSAGLFKAEMEGLACLASCEARLGRGAEADAIAARLEEAGRRRYISPFFGALLAAGRRDREATLSALRAAVAERATRVIELHCDPRFTWLHGDDDFRALVAGVGFAPIRTLG
jgi:serine/threonine protein kinase/Flp pilus assembly protein TadD